MDHLFPYPKMGNSFLEVLHDPLTRKLLGFDATHAEKVPFVSGVVSRLSFFLQDPTKHLSFLKIGYTALEAFLQANCTGPPLNFNVEETIFSEIYRAEGLPELRKELVGYLTVDGHSIYPLAPSIELFWLAKIIMSNASMAEEGFNGRRARIRVNYWHQKLLSEQSDALRDAIYNDFDILEHQLSSRLAFGGAAAEEHFVEFLIERAVIRTFYGEDIKAREDLTHAATTRNFQFALTGVLGKRTKFQSSETSQLLVLAKSRDHEPEPYSSRKGSQVEGLGSRKSSQADSQPTTPLPKSPSIPGLTPRHSFGMPLRPLTPSSAKPHEHEHHVSPSTNAFTHPTNIPLHDDTLLERIAYKQMTHQPPELATISELSNISPVLTSLDPSDQPLLFPMDSIILLATASSITNTSPTDGLTREQTLPYAERVLEGGSSNWQVYTQALLVRSRIEGYKSRTAERGLLQLQALVDQIIAETTTSMRDSSKAKDSSIDDDSGPNTFLPKANSSESASVAERLKYIYQLSPPLRWDLESELASRWTSMGGFKTALEIYERLQMHAEVALCLAATNQEAEAIKLIKKVLFKQSETMEDHTTTEKIRDPPPPEAPRLLCILGDMTESPRYYSLSWTVSKSRYARAQRSIGRYNIKKRNFLEAAEAYSLALSVARVDFSTWFALGCVQLELEDWPGAVESFTRCVQLEDKDPESWSNLAVALMRLPAQESTTNSDDPESSFQDPYIHTREALQALRRAATLQRDDARIWDNYLTVAARIPPTAGTPWNDIVQALTRIIELRSKKEGEASIDLKILDVLIKHVTEEYTYPIDNGVESEELSLSSSNIEESEENGKEDFPEIAPHDLPTTTTQNTKLPYLPRSLLSLIDTQISPLATSSAPLFYLLARVAIWRNRPHESLLNHEKAWRAITSSTGGNDPYETKQGFEAIVSATEDLVRQYKELGPMERERTGGQVESNWRFKCRSCVRSVMGKAKAKGLDDDDRWKRLEALKEESD